MAENTKEVRNEDQHEEQREELFINPICLIAGHVLQVIPANGKWDDVKGTPKLYQCLREPCDFVTQIGVW